METRGTNADNSGITLRTASEAITRNTVTPPVMTGADGTLKALINIVPTNPKEFSEVTSTTEALKPLAQATGGDARRVADGLGCGDPAHRAGALVLGVRRAPQDEGLFHGAPLDPQGEERCSCHASRGCIAFVAMTLN
jgi:hypothetical protein